MRTPSRTRSGGRPASVVAGLLLAAGTTLAACGSGSEAETPAPRHGISAVFDEIYDDNFEANNAAAPYDRFDIVYVRVRPHRPRDASARLRDQGRQADRAPTPPGAQGQDRPRCARDRRARAGDQPRGGGTRR